MGYVFRKIEVYQKKDGTWNTAGDPDFEITIGTKTSILIGLGKKKDIATITFDNIDNQFFNGIDKLSTDDVLRIYQKRDSDSFTSADLLIEMTIRDVPEKINPSGRKITIKGHNLIEAFFDIQIPAGYTNKKWFEILDALKAEINGLSIGKEFLLSFPATKKDGSDFPTISYTCNYKPFSQILEDLTSDKYTEDGQYEYILTIGDTENTLTISARTAIQDTAAPNEGVIEEGVTEVNSFNIQRSKDNIANFVIFNVGNDLYDKSVEGMHFDPLSMGKNGFKYLYIIEETADIINNIIADERENNASSFGDSDNFPTSYNYTFFKKDKDSNDVVATSASDFNDKLRDLAEDDGKLYADNIIRDKSTPTYKVRCLMPFTNEYTMGNQYRLKIPSRNMNRLLRLTEIKYQLLQSDLLFEEDSELASN